MPLKCWILLRQVGIWVVDQAPTHRRILYLGTTVALLYVGALVLELGLATDHDVAILSGVGRLLLNNYSRAHIIRAALLTQCVHFSVTIMFNIQLSFFN